MKTAKGKSIINIKSVVNFGGIEVASFFLPYIYFIVIHTHVFLFTISSNAQRYWVTLQRHLSISSLCEIHFHFQFVFLFIPGAYLKVEETKCENASLFSTSACCWYLLDAEMCFCVCFFADFSSKNNYSYYENASLASILPVFFGILKTFSHNFSLIHFYLKFTPMYEDKKISSPGHRQQFQVYSTLF